MHGKLVHEAKKNGRKFWREGEAIRRGGKEDWGHSEGSFWRGFCFVLAAAWQVADLFRCASVLLSCCVMS